MDFIGKNNPSDFLFPMDFAKRRNIIGIPTLIECNYEIQEICVYSLLYLNLLHQSKTVMWLTLCSIYLLKGFLTFLDDRANIGILFVCQ